MEQVVTMLASVVIEVVVLVLGAMGVWLSKKVKEFLDKKKEADDLGIIDILTDRAVEYVEAEFKGLKGADKRAHALAYATEFLSARKINISETEILAALENGVNKLHEKQILKHGTFIDGVLTEDEGDKLEK